MNNKTIGNQFEKEYAEILSKQGFWVTFITPKTTNGSQPCDLIAIKDNIAFLIDCKTSESKSFPLKRIEQNQREAFKKYQYCGNMNYYLAIKHENKIYKIDMAEIDFKQKNINLEGRTYEDYSFK